MSDNSVFDHFRTATVTHCIQKYAQAQKPPEMQHTYFSYSDLDHSEVWEEKKNKICVVHIFVRVKVHRLCLSFCLKKSVWGLNTQLQFI